MRRDKLRRTVREMEAFGWVLDETEDLPKKLIRLKLWRSLDLPNLNKLRKLEFDLARIPGEYHALNLKFIGGILICALIATGLSTTAIGSVMFAVIWVVGFEIIFLALAYLVTPEYKRLANRRDRILYRARTLVEQGATSAVAVPGDGDNKSNSAG